MTSEPNLPIVKFDKPNHVRTYAAPYLRADSEGREVIWATPRYFLTSPEIDRAALVKALNKVSKIRTAFHWTFSIVCVTLIWLDSEFLGVNSFEWVLFASVVISNYIESRWFQSRLQKTLHPHADHLTEVDVPAQSLWSIVLSSTATVLAILLLVFVLGIPLFK